MATKTTQRAILPSGAESVNFLTNTSVKSVNNLFALKAECIHLEVNEYDMMNTICINIWYKWALLKITCTQT